MEKYRKYLEDLYERVQGTKDQWPPVQFKEYIKLATVVKVEDFTEEDECTKAMMNGKLQFIMRCKKRISIRKVGHWHSCVLRVVLPIQCPDWQVGGWYIG